MRELKFRAWDARISKFWDFNTNTGSPTREIIKVGSDKDGLTHLISHPDFTWQQYTGLKDKNGVEIYEGDILEVSQCDTVSKVDVEFVNGGFSPFCNPYAVLCEIHGFSNVKSDNCKVIGNIWENPDLLKEQL